MLGSGGLEGPSELHRHSLEVGVAPRQPVPTPKPTVLPGRPVATGPEPRAQAIRVEPLPRARPRPNSPPRPSFSHPTAADGENQVQTAETPLMAAVPELGGDLSNSGRGSEISYLLLEITPSAEGTVPPSRLFLGLVVDVSGSMGDQGVQLAAEASAQLFSALKPADHGFLIAFASEARRLSLPRLDANSICDALHGAGVGGGTNLAMGAELARGSMPEGSTGTLRHVMLVTDGYTQDETRCKSVCQEAWKRGISVSTIGIGNCSSSLLKSIADRCSGSFYHVDSLRDLSGVVVADRRKVEAVVLRNLEVEARFAPGVFVRRAFRMGSLAEIKPVQGRFALGNLYSNKPLQLLFELEVKGASGRSQKIAEVDLHSRNPDGSRRSPQPMQQIWADRVARKSPANPHVMALVDRIYAALSRR